MICRSCAQTIRFGRRRFFRQISTHSYVICDKCGKAQHRSVEFNPTHRAFRDEALVMFEKTRMLLGKVKLKILIWGPDPRSKEPLAEKRNEIRATLEEQGHKVYFSEDLIFDKSYLVPANVQERVQVDEMDAVVCLAKNPGALQEAQEFAKAAKDFLLWLSDEARGRYSDIALGQQLRAAGRPPEFFQNDDLKSCVVAAATAEWILQRRIGYLAIELERERLEAMAPRSR